MLCYLISVHSYHKPTSQIINKKIAKHVSIGNMKRLTFWEEVGPGSILTDVEVFPEFAASFKPEHGVVIQAVVPEQHDAARLQNLYSTCK